MSKLGYWPGLLPHKTMVFSDPQPTHGLQVSRLGGQCIGDLHSKVLFGSLAFLFILVNFL